MKNCKRAKKKKKIHKNKTNRKTRVNKTIRRKLKIMQNLKPYCNVLCVKTMFNSSSLLIVKQFMVYICFFPFMYAYWLSTRFPYKMMFMYFSSTGATKGAFRSTGDSPQLFLWDSCYSVCSLQCSVLQIIVGRLVRFRFAIVICVCVLFQFPTSKDCGQDTWP